MSLQTKQIIKNICPLYKEPNRKYPLESELLFGEYFDVEIINEKWVFGHNQNDNYRGWIELKNLSDTMLNQHKITFIHSLVYKKPLIKSKILFNLFLGSVVKIVNIDNNWSEIIIDEKNKTGFIHTKSASSLSFIIEDWVSIAEKFLGVPYKWGGKSLLGIDCSGLVQIAIQLSGNSFPRNTNEQINMNFNTIINLNELRRGDLIFWDGHVGIMQDQEFILHANEYHMQVSSEPLLCAIKRIKRVTKNKPSFKRIKNHL